MRIRSSVRLFINTLGRTQLQDFMATIISVSEPHGSSLVRCGMLPARPKLSDDDLLAAVCGHDGLCDAVSLRRCLRDRIGADVALSYIEERVERLHRAGLVRVFRPHAGDQPLFRLTQTGIDRLRDLESEPVRPPTD